VPSLASVPTYLVETYQPHGRGVEELSRLEARARAAVHELSRLRAEVRYVRAILVPEDETCFYVFEAPSREVVAQAAIRAGLSGARITESVETSKED
jgi:Protein of unknown function (DUF4242)